jgi:hypothetical protein
LEGKNIELSLESDYNASSVTGSRRKNPWAKMEASSSKKKVSSSIQSLRTDSTSATSTVEKETESSLSDSKDGAYYAAPYGNIMLLSTVTSLLNPEDHTLPSSATIAYVLKNGTNKANKSSSSASANSVLYDQYFTTPLQPKRTQQAKTIGCSSNTKHIPANDGKPSEAIKSKPTNINTLPGLAPTVASKLSNSHQLPDYGIDDEPEYEECGSSASMIGSDDRKSLKGSVHRRQKIKRKRFRLCYTVSSFNLIYSYL